MIGARKAPKQKVFMLAVGGKKNQKHKPGDTRATLVCSTEWMKAFWLPISL